VVSAPLYFGENKVNVWNRFTVFHIRVNYFQFLFFLMSFFSAVCCSKLAHNVSRLQEVAMNQDQAFTNINKTFN